MDPAKPSNAQANAPDSEPGAPHRTTPAAPGPAPATPPASPSAAHAPTLLTAPALAATPHLAAAFPAAAHRLLAALVRDGAALGWVEPPSPADVAALLDDVSAAARAGDAALRAAYLGDRLLGLGYWLRYARPTHRPHADLEKLAVAAEAHGRGVGRALAAALVADARAAYIEVLTSTPAATTPRPAPLPLAGLHGVRQASRVRGRRGAPLRQGLPHAGPPPSAGTAGTAARPALRPAATPDRTRSAPAAQDPDSPAAGLVRDNGPMNTPSNERPPETPRWWWSDPTAWHAGPSRRATAARTRRAARSR